MIGFSTISPPVRHCWARLKPLLGDDIILWGASVMIRKAGDVHDWHTDIESSARDGRFVSVWVGPRTPVEVPRFKSPLARTDLANRFSKSFTNADCTEAR